MSKCDFELVEHTADIQLRIYGKTLAELFRHAVIGMFQSIGPKISGCRKIDGRIVCQRLPQKRGIVVNSFDLESLLVDFLSDVLYFSDIHDEAYLDADILEVDEKHINATLHGIKVEGFEVVEIKAVTYHNLKVESINGLWQVDVVFDI